MKISLLQADLVWENKAANLQYFDTEMEKIAKKAEKTDIIVLPELFSTGFSMQAALFAENIGTDGGANSPTLTQMRAWAAHTDALVLGSMMAAEQGVFYNRLLAVRPDGTYWQYDKRHLFAKGGEDKYYTAGSEKLVFDWREWRIMPLICYDLRFPVWARNTTDYDLAIYVANWPHARAAHWTALLQARAIENQAYTVGLNRVGFDGNGLWHSGDSAVIDPEGNYILRIAQQPNTAFAELDKTHLHSVRERLPFLKDRD